MNKLEELKKMLDDAGIECEIFDKKHIKVLIGDDYISIVFHKYSNGYEKGLLEMMGGLTEYEQTFNCFKGHLSVEEAFKRIKYCVENNTDTYVEEETFEVGDEVYVVEDSDGTVRAHTISNIVEDKAYITYDGWYVEISMLQFVSKSKCKYLEYLYVESHKRILEEKEIQQKLLKQMEELENEI